MTFSAEELPEGLQLDSFTGKITGVLNNRVDKSHNREAGRFGLGLFAVKTIIEKHNGIVGVLNTQKGVLFYFEIPELQVTNTEKI